MPLNIKSSDIKYFSWVYEIEPQSLSTVKYSSVFYIGTELTNATFGHISSFYSIENSRIKKIILLSRSILFRRFHFFNRRNVCFACNPWSNNYFHWFTEVLPRVIKAAELHENLLFLFPFELNEQYQLPSLEKLNINYKSIPNKIFFARNLFFSQPSRESTGHFSTHHFKMIREKFCIPEIGVRKIYVHRNSNKRSIVNSEEVKYSFIKKGFEVVELENATLNDQISLFSQATILASIHGAALTNMLFMREGSTILEFGLNGEKYDKCYFNMAREINHIYYYQGCFSPDKLKTYTESNLYVDIIELEAVLSEILISNQVNPR
jgi:capsular polysaccharide biosynthesis protein